MKIQAICSFYLTWPRTILCWCTLPHTLSYWTAVILNSVQKMQKLWDRRSWLNKRDVLVSLLKKWMTGYDNIPYKEKSVMGEMAVPHLILNLNMFESSSERKSRLVRYPPYAWGRRQQKKVISHALMLNDTVIHFIKRELWEY